MSVVPAITALGTRLTEHGRIRTGVKDGRAMRPLSTFRFTSADQTAIEQVAEVYGGEVKPWSDKKASPQNQWEVITEASEIRVWLAEDAVSVWYELWSGAGRQRQCDGVTVSLRDDEQPCICNENERLECRPTTRLRVVLPDVRFGGVWRMESKGWNVAHEMPAMEMLIKQMQARGLIEGRLRLEQRQTQGGARKFIVPALLVDASPDAIVSGEVVQRQIAAPMRPELGSGESDSPVVDAEIIPSLDEIRLLIDELGVEIDVPAPSLEQAIVDRLTKGKESTLARVSDGLLVEIPKAIELIRAGERKVSVGEDGRWVVSK